MQQAVIRFLSEPTAMFVAEHSLGFTVVEHLSDQIDLREGDPVTGDWLGWGGSDFEHAGKAHQSFQHSCWSSLEEAISRAKVLGEDAAR